MIFLISGPSGIGKNSVIKELQKDKKLNISLSVSYTTRDKRFNEINGKDYYFVNKNEFLEKIKKNEFLEYAQFVDNYYGTCKKEIERIINLNKNVLLEIETVGANNIFKQFLNNKQKIVSIFIVPIKIEDLKKRLENRNTNSKEDIKKRFDLSLKEIEERKKFDYIVCNDKLENAIFLIKKILNYEISLKN
ncbi:guanylate kinase [symbiont of Argiope bruennichi]|uniref:guanylate kinase n=1 Tax=symbiont of Argiope bruennichi TaxID=2810479 RepID=UPI003DA5093E